MALASVGRRPGGWCGTGGRRSTHVLVEEAPADEALALRLAVARDAAPEEIALVRVVLEHVVRDLLLGARVRG